MAVKRFNISLDEHLLRQLDHAAKLEYASRSEYIRGLVVKHLMTIRNAVAAKAVSDEELEEAYNTLRQERARRMARAEIKKLRRQGH